MITRHLPEKFTAFFHPLPIRILAACAVILPLVLALSGCANVLAPEKPVPHFILKPAPPSLQHNGPPINATLAISRPTIPSSMDSDRIGLLKPNREVQFFAGARWFTTIPQLFQALVVQSFEQSNTIQGVTTDDINIHPNYRLSWDIRAFHAVYDKNKSIPDITIAITVWLIDNKTDKLLGNRAFRYSRPASGKKLEDIVLSFEKTIAPVLSDLVTWTTQTIRSHSGQ